MSIIELGALGEFLGSIGVIATLIYLAIQVRVGARNTAIEARQRVLDRFADAKANIIHSDFAVGIRKVSYIEEPSDAELLQYWTTMAVFADNLYNAIRLNDEGVLDDEAFEFIAGAFVRTCASPGGNGWWKSFATAAPPTLSKFVNERLEAVSIQRGLPPYGFREEINRILSELKAESEENEQ